MVWDINMEEQDVKGGGEGWVWMRRDEEVGKGDETRRDETTTTTRRGW
jgi:hypothetical protein